MKSLDQLRKRVRKALERNRHVLLVKRRFPRRLPPCIGFGKDSERVSYAAENLGAWKEIPGAPDWPGSVLRDFRPSRGR